MNKFPTNLDPLHVQRWADQLRKEIDESTFTKAVEMSLTFTFNFGALGGVAFRWEEGRCLSMRRIVRTGSDVSVVDGTEVTAEVREDEIRQIASALHDSLRRAGLPTCPHTLTLVPEKDLHAKVPEYSWLIDKLLRERGALYAALAAIDAARAKG